VIPRLTLAVVTNAEAPRADRGLTQTQAAIGVSAAARAIEDAEPDSADVPRE
jgi:hypothetical protein